jgi:hypothetical protein
MLDDHDIEVGKENGKSLFFTLSVSISAIGSISTIQMGG